MTTVKPTGYDFYRDVLKSPKYVVAPMVDQSELAWRVLSRRYGAQLIYTPMINAKMFADNTAIANRRKYFDIASGEEGNPTMDRPLLVQFCANDPEKLLASALVVQDYCDGIDINLGCPQDIAKKGKYGAFLQDDWDLIYKLINILHVNLKVPVTAKFRVFPSVEKTVEYAKMLERAGAQILTCHGRIREQRGVNSGLADWSQIRAVKAAVSIPVFANGNILYPSDIARCLAETACDGVMSAEGQLYNPALFQAPDSEAPLVDQHLFHVDLALEYLDICQSLKTHTPLSAIKGHLFKIMRPGLTRETDLREKLGKAKVEKDGDWRKGGLKPYVDVCLEMKERMLKVKEEYGEGEMVRVDEETGLPVLPCWLAQPYFRPVPVPVMKTKAAPKVVEKRAGDELEEERDGGGKLKRVKLMPEAVALAA